MKPTAYIYGNTWIPKRRFVFVKCIKVERFPTNNPHPDLLIVFRVGPMHEDLKGKLFYSYLHGTQEAQQLVGSFVNAFKRHPDEPIEDCIGSWGSVELVPNQYQATKHSLVRFCHQPIPIRLKVLEIEEADRNGTLNEMCGNEVTV